VFGLLALAISVVAGRGTAASLPVIPITVVLAFCAGSAYAATTVSAQTALFENMPPGARGRIFGVLASIVSAASLLPILVAGPLADKISGPVVMAIAAVAVALAAVLSATMFGPRRGSGEIATAS